MGIGGFETRIFPETETSRCRIRVITLHDVILSPKSLVIAKGPYGSRPRKYVPGGEVPFFFKGNFFDMF